MSRIKPYQGTSKERLSQLVRDAQRPPLASTVSFDFNQPIADTDSEVIGATIVETTAKTSKRTDPPVNVNYKRLSAEVLLDLPPGELLPFDPLLFPTTVHAILPVINQALGLNLLPEEVVNTSLLTIPENGITITITENSLAWRAGSYLFTYAPHADKQAGRGVNNAIPTDERRRIRVLELPV